MPLQAERCEGEGEPSQFSLSGNWGNVPFKICQGTEGNMYQYMKNYPPKNFPGLESGTQTASVPNHSLLTAAKLFRINAVSHLPSSFVSTTRRSTQRRPRRRSSKPTPPDAGLPSLGTTAQNAYGTLNSRQLVFLRVYMPAS